VNDRLFEELRPVGFAVAYRMLSSVIEAEDIVQEAFLRLHATWTGGTAMSSLRIVSTPSMPGIAASTIATSGFVRSATPTPAGTSRPSSLFTTQGGSIPRRSSSRQPGPKKARRRGLRASLHHFESEVGGARFLDRTCPPQFDPLRGEILEEPDAVPE
jgi:Sigma-70 region 2